jgi:photosystem II stability/assembly factor-like uncharacterized protein
MTLVALLTVLLPLVEGPIASATPGRAVPGRWISNGPEQADVTSIAISPSDPSWMYVGTGNGAIYRSEDAGATWTRAFQSFDAFPIEYVAVDARDPRLVLTLESANEPGILIRTEDGFATTTRDPFKGEIDVVAADPVRGGRFYLGGYYEDFQASRDGGVTWSSVELRAGRFADSPTAIAVDPADPSRLYVGAGDRVYRSQSSGRSFVALSIRCRIRCLPVPSPAQAGVVYVANDRSIRRSEDAGQHWVRTGAAPAPIRALVADPTDPMDIFVATSHGVLRSADGGGTWTTRNHGLSEQPDARTLAFDPGDPSTLWVGTTTGAFRSTNGGGAWTRRSNGLVDAWVRAVEVVPATGRVLAATVDGPTFLSDDGGDRWRTFRLPGSGRVPSFLVDPQDPSRILTGGDHIRVSNDGGAHWRVLPSGPPGVVGALAIIPGHPAILLAHAGGHIYRSVAGSGRWSVVADQGDLLDSLVVDPSDPSVVYAPAFDRLLRSDDAGKTWQRIGKELGSLLVGSVAPLGDGTVLASSWNGVFRSSDQGTSWQRLLAFRQEIVPGFPTGLPVLRADPSEQHTVYAATDGVVARSTDDGNHWYRIGTGLPARDTAWSLAVDPARRMLYVGSLRRGVFQFRLP